MTDPPTDMSYTFNSLRKESKYSVYESLNKNRDLDKLSRSKTVQIRAEIRDSLISGLGPCHE